MIELTWLLAAMWIGVISNMALGIAKNIFTMKLTWDKSKFFRGLGKGALVSLAFYGVASMFSIIHMLGYELGGVEEFAPSAILLLGVAYQITVVGGQLKELVKSEIVSDTVTITEVVESVEEVLEDATEVVELDLTKEQ